MTTVSLLHRDSELGQRLAGAIAAAPGLAMTGIAGSVPAMREQLARAVPDLLAVDLMLPPGPVHTLLHELRHDPADAPPRLLVLAVSADDPRVMEALRRGADSYFAHAHSELTLPQAIQQLARGESTITPQIAREVKSHFEAASAHRAPLQHTDRCLLQWLAEGFLVSEVARALRLNVHAVGVRVRALYRQLQRELRAQYPPQFAA